MLVPSALRAAAERKIDTSRLKESLGLPSTVESARQALVPLDKQGEVLEALGRETDDLLFGARLASQHVRGEFGLTEYLFRTAHNVREALRAVARFSGMANSALHLDFVEGPRHFGIYTELSLGRQWNEWLMGFFAQLLADVLPPGALTNVTVRLAHPRHTEHRQLLEVLLISRVEFNAPANSIILPAALAVAPLTTSDPMLHAILVEHAERTILAVHDESPFLMNVREYVRHELPHALPTLTGAAKALGVSPRWLQRKLATERTSFQSVVTAARITGAKDLLRRHHKVLEVALTLHYSDPTAFTRAFRRETGVTPARFRGERAGMDMSPPVRHQ
ncbi:MAG: AraC family transcriptional regulator ligand-binding domain-containing protein [Myxococcaceae bacterium]